jgi:hypothetical protein
MMDSTRTANTATINNASIIPTPTHALPLGKSDLRRARKTPFGSRHWSGKIKLQSAPVKSADVAVSEVDRCAVAVHADDHAVPRDIRLFHFACLPVHKQSRLDSPYPQLLYFAGTVFIPFEHSKPKAAAIWRPFLSTTRLDLDQYSGLSLKLRPPLERPFFFSDLAKLASESPDRG